MICVYLTIQNFFRIKPYVCIYVISCNRFQFGVEDSFFFFFLVNFRTSSSDYMKFEYDAFYATAHSYLRADELIQLPRNYFQDGCPAPLIYNVQTWRKRPNSHNALSATIWLKIFRSDIVVGLYPLSQTFHWRKPNRHFRSPTLYVLLPLGWIFVFAL
jgi:hypothetical protein